MILPGIRKKHSTIVSGLINYISHVDELILHVKEGMFEDNKFPILLELGKEVPTFSNLKHLEATMCFNDHNFVAVVSMLHHCPALQSVKLVHEAREKYYKVWRWKDWASKLSVNEDGNHCYVHLINLHTGENNKQFKKC